MRVRSSGGRRSSGEVGPVRWCSSAAGRCGDGEHGAGSGSGCALGVDIVGTDVGLADVMAGWTGEEESR